MMRNPSSNRNNEIVLRESKLGRIELPVSNHLIVSGVEVATHLPYAPVLNI